MELNPGKRITGLIIVCVQIVMLVLQTNPTAANEEPVTFVTLKKSLTQEQQITFSVPPGQRQLFIDDDGIAAIKNLKRTMHQPVKKGAVITADASWEGSVQSWCTPEWVPEDRCFKLWIYSSSKSGKVGISYGESKDGIHWTKPILRMVEIDGSFENNLFTRDLIYNVIYDPDAADPSRRYKGLRLNSMSEKVISADGINWIRSPEITARNYFNYYLAFVLNIVHDPKNPDPSQRYTGVGYSYNREPMVSADGIHWRSLNFPGIPTADEGLLTYDPLTKTYIATVKQGELGLYGRSVALTTSTDFERWTNTELIFHADEQDWGLARQEIMERLNNTDMVQPVYNDPAEYRCDVYNMRVFNYEGIYIGLPSFFLHTGLNPAKINWDGFSIIKMASSRDLKTWARLGDRKPFISPSVLSSGAYDLTYIKSLSCPVVMGNELWFYYVGYKYRVAPKGIPNEGAVCRAVLRRDGFISLDAERSEGEVVTKPFILTGSKLFVNSDAKNGWIQVEITDAEGKPVAVSGKISGDSPRGEVMWETGKFEKIKGHVVSLRITVKNAQLYSYWAEE
ncbi:MAG: hypothetical protein WCU00_05170 [Candidatus Latescibacterota bacterium]